MKDFLDRLAVAFLVAFSSKRVVCIQVGEKILFSMKSDARHAEIAIRIVGELFREEQALDEAKQLINHS